MVLLSHPSSFVGGGTRYEYCDAVHCVDKGSLLVHSGKMRHSGVAITQRTRYVLVGFMNVQSCMIGRPQEGEPPIPENASDKRHWVFLWRGCPPLGVPRRIAVRIINLQFRPEKREQILKVMRRLCIPVGVELDVQVVVADEGGGATAYASWKSTEAAEKIGGRRKRFWCRDVRRGEIGNFGSHLTTVQAASNCDYMLVLEDDANFHSDLLYRIEQFLKELSVSEQAWDVIDLGGIPIDNCPPISISESLCQRQCTHQVHFMLYSKSGLAKLAGVNRTVNAIQSDEFIPAARGIHPREALNALWPIGLNVVHTSDRLSWQTGGSIHDTEECKAFGGGNPKLLRFLQNPFSLFSQTLVTSFSNSQNLWRFFPLVVAAFPCLFCTPWILLVLHSLYFALCMHSSTNPARKPCTFISTKQF